MLCKASGDWSPALLEKLVYSGPLDGSLLISSDCCYRLLQKVWHRTSNT
jgi:hypothetical protein